MEIIEKVWDNIISLKILKDNKHLKGAYLISYVMACKHWGIKYYQILPNITKYYQILSNIISYFY